MAPEAGELLVGAYLQVCDGCELVGYNVHLTDPGLAGMGEIDVVALNFSNQTAYVCEVATHLEGLDYGDGNAATLETLKKKFNRDHAFAERYLKSFKSVELMLWSPVVPKGALTTGLATLGVTLAVNEDYGRRIEALRTRAAASAKEYGNVAFRVLQVLARMRPQTPGSPTGPVA